MIENEELSESANKFKNAPIIASEVQRKCEKAIIWELKNWNDSNEFNVNVLNQHATCDVVISDKVSFRFFLKDQKKVVSGSHHTTETDRLSLCVRQLLINPKVKEKGYCDVGFALKITVEFLNEDLQHLDSPPGYKSNFESGITLDFKSGRNLTDEKVVIDEFILLSQTTITTRSFNSTSTQTIFNRPEILRCGIFVELFSCAYESLSSSSSSSSSPTVPKSGELEHELPIFKDFERMYAQKDNYFDLKLESRDGELINVHKFVLAARSSKFKAIIEEQTKRNDFSGTIKIGDVNAKPLLAILNWMYIGKLNDNQFGLEGGDSILEELIIACGNYELDDLIKLCEKKLITVCNPVNMLHLFQAALKYGMQDAAKEISEFIKQNIDGAIFHMQI